LYHNVDLHRHVSYAELGHFVCFDVFQKANVIEEWAGLRPGRTSVRLEAEELTFDGRTVKVCEHLLLSV